MFKKSWKLEVGSRKGKKNRVMVHVSWFIALLFIFSCNSGYIYKPSGYPKVIFPEHGYQNFKHESFPFTFEYPTYAKTIRDSVFFGDKPENPYWLNVFFPDFNATVYLSYKEIKGKDDLQKLENDAHELTYKHTIKAEYIDEGQLSSAPDVKGVIYDVGGNAASSTQFYLTDSLHNFIRGSLYFYSRPNIDSLGDVIKFINQDIYHLIKTFRWSGVVRRDADHGSVSTAKKP